MILFHLTSCLIFVNFGVMPQKNPDFHGEIRGIPTEFNQVTPSSTNDQLQRAQEPLSS